MVVLRITVCVCVCVPVCMCVQVYTAFVTKVHQATSRLQQTPQSAEEFAEYLEVGVSVLLIV